MIYFNCDYLEGGHPKILEKMLSTNMEQLTGYSTDHYCDSARERIRQACGCPPKILEKMLSTNMEQLTGYSTDHYCDSARERIRQACGCPDADVHFLVGGTQTNLTAIASILRPYQGVLAAHDGHIACHETGAIEATGHKVLPIPCVDGKITADQVREFCHSHQTNTMREHMVQPGMVYISFPTEIGSLYTKKELKELSAACHENGIPLYIDGARMGYGLTSPDADVTLQDIASLCDMFYIGGTKCGAVNENGIPLYIDGARMGYGLTSPDADVTLQDIASLCDMFYIGGTKCGAVMGEALVITNPSLKEGFRYTIKQHGGLLAKGRYLGIQFDVLFEDNLYFTICKKAVEQSMAIRRAFEEKGIQLDSDSSTNQQFPILTCEQMDKLAQKYAYEIWEEYDETHTVVRFCTSWATQDQNVQQLLEDIRAL